MKKFELSQEELELIQNIQKTPGGFGGGLTKLLEHFCDFMADTRNMDDLDSQTMMARAMAAKLVKQEIISRIRLVNVPRAVKVNSFV